MKIRTKDLEKFIYVYYLLTRDEQFISRYVDFFNYVPHGLEHTQDTQEVYASLYGFAFIGVIRGNKLDSGDFVFKIYNDDRFPHIYFNNVSLDARKPEYINTFYVYNHFLSSFMNETNMYQYEASPKEDFLEIPTGENLIPLKETLDLILTLRGDVDHKEVYLDSIK